MGNSFFIDTVARNFPRYGRRAPALPVLARPFGG